MRVQEIMHPRSYLFVPGDRPERFAKARQSEADAIIIDLEDAVAPAAKASARDAVCQWLATGGQAYVRINACDTPWFDEDLASLGVGIGLLGIVVPKTESARVLGAIASALPDSAVLLPLLETAVGFDNLREIAHCPKVARLLFGTLDFQVDMGIRGDGDELLYFRSQLTHLSRVAGLAAPVDGVTTSIDDGDLIRFEAARARNLGFRGKLCIHPRQISHVHTAFSPTADEIEWARRVVAAVSQSNGGVTTVDGKMVDPPVILKATEILKTAGLDV
jgi:citrate lyase subunit beta/citryl-CoA lyase